jgi:hypothetical protein
MEIFTYNVFMALKNRLIDERSSEEVDLNLRQENQPI